MAEYKFTYLDVTALGEVSRYLFAYGDIPFDDVRVPLESYEKKDESFMELKKDLPFGLLPTLEFDGKLITQSEAIARYLAIKVGLYGNDPMEGVLIDEAYGNIEDLRKKFSEVIYSKPDNQASLLAELKSNWAPFYLSRFDKAVGENGGHFAIPRWNLADILFGSYLLYFKTTIGDDLLQEYPNLQKLESELEALPGIKDYIKNRPKTIR